MNIRNTLSGDRIHESKISELKAIICSGEKDNKDSSPNDQWLGRPMEQQSESMD